ncbi:glutathione-disulfide reductase [Pleomorphomonas sp. NRK KF1]|uniref:glutathione-disulfide reductase n=1 Tax=Pleomorphomonas sp. NRK KF1 TaxID=2943000 RepID=UPI0020440E39|nr:glutathione-disulfide reductase [Pleomorphomonas sp. NRK KF1]MCM5551603.1 glutathione-disulfide reductase [Pleomorphomonas sp. NRK KF1]
MASFDYDLFVIGAGSGGVRAARISAGYGARVAIAEESRIGGTCVIRGCVPKKLLVYASRFAAEFNDAAGFGWSVGERSFDWEALRASKEREITRLEGIYAGNLQRSGVEVIRDRAVITGPNEIRLVAEERTITAERILIATGNRPVLPDIPGIEHAVTSTDMFDLPTLPAKAVVVGGGYIALEFASILVGLGVATTVLYRGEQVLRGFDREVRDKLADALRARGIDLRTGIQVRRIDKTAVGLAVSLTDGSDLDTDLVLAATGRHPNTTGLGLEALGVALDQDGAVVVNALSETTVPSIYAVGDVTNRAQLTPVAIREGHAFADTVFGGRESFADHSILPTAIFTTPEVGTVGLSEEAACAAYTAVDVYKAEFRPMRNILAGRDERTFMKVVVDAITDRVLGVHIMGPEAGEMIQTIGIAMTMGATKRDFDRTMAVHPTAAEELVTLRTPSVRHR